VIAKGFMHVFELSPNLPQQVKQMFKSVYMQVLQIGFVHLAKTYISEVDPKV